MKFLFVHSIGFLLLAIYLILIGITALVPAFTVPPMVMAILALIAGILILINV